MAKTTVEIISHLQLLGFLTTNGSGCRFVGITYKTEVEKIKKGHPFGRLFKVSKLQGIVNADFVEAVKARLANILDVAKKEVVYEAGKSSYVHPFPSAPCVLAKASNPNDGVYYLQYMPTEGKTEYVYVNENNEVVDTEKVKPWLYAKSARSEYKPAVVSLMLSRIVEMRASGLILTTEDMDDAKVALSQAA